jgi:trimeric autotransporter adhesin
MPYPLVQKRFARDRCQNRRFGQGRNDMAAIHNRGARFAAFLAGCGIFCLGLVAGPAMAGCNSGNAASTDQLSSANCQANAAGLSSIGIGNNAQSTGTASIAIGTGTSAANAARTVGASAVAVGFDAQGSGDGSVAYGGTTRATGLNSVALGRNSNATANQAIGVGDGSAASGTGSVAIGQSAEAQSANGVAIGNNATAVQTGSIAIGQNAFAQSSVAVGTGAQANGTTTTAIGDNAIANGANSVALGNGSVANQANTVSVGTAGGERRVTNVAPGVNGTDAVNVNQLNAVAIGGAAPLVDQLISRMDSLETRLDEVARNSNRGIAGVAAMAGAVPTTPGKTTLNLGLGAYQGESAIGASVAHLTSSGRFNLNGGVSFSGGKSVARVGAGITF